MKMYLSAIGFLVALTFCVLAALSLGGCASHKLAATTYREASHKPAPALPVRPQFSDSAKAAMKAEAAARRKAAEIKTALKIAAKAQADSLRIVAHTPCPVTEIPKPKRHRSKGCSCP